MSTDLDYMSATQLRRLIARKELSPVELVQHSLARAESAQSRLNCFTIIDSDRALAQARIAEQALMVGGPVGMLHGLPVSVKDLIAVKDLPYTSGSRATADYIASADAPSVERLRRAGAIIIGKTTTSEFGCKPVGDSPLTGITRNPWNDQKTPGGSSAGAAASIAAGVTSFGLGTDGGGSIRIPCSFSGLAGIKGQFGRVPVWPTSATPSLAHVGPMARNIEDAALLFTAIAGYDERDPASVTGPIPDLLGACRSSVAGLRIAWSPTLGYAEPDGEVVSICEKAATGLEEAGCIVEEVTNVFDEDPIPLWTAEFYAGVGTRLRDTLETKRDILDPAVAELLEAALSQSMRSYYESVFARYALHNRSLEIFQRYDVVLSPVLPVSSLEIGLNKPERLQHRSLVSWVYYTYPFNLLGFPAGTVCAGLASDNMPVGIQIAAGPLCEYNIAIVASAIEAVQPPGYNFAYWDRLHDHSPQKLS
jgi:aspartyl-tRNA(Asn)/glutamyl-tRNA(Gln) amidotransferase subunit A